MLDEPASGLSEGELEELGKFIVGLRSKMGVLLVEHHMDLVMSICDRLVVLNFGRVIAAGTPCRGPGEPRGDHRVSRTGRLDRRPEGDQCRSLTSKTSRCPTGPSQALTDVSFSAAEGEVTAVLGANGAGKTTLLRAISGLVHPRKGTIRYDGQQLEKMSVEKIVRHGVAHVTEGRSVIEEMTVEENLRLGVPLAFRPTRTRCGHR